MQRITLKSGDGYVVTLRFTGTRVDPAINPIANRQLHPHEVRTAIRVANYAAKAATQESSR